MAHSYTNLWPQVTSWDNLSLAYRRCRRHKRFKRGALQFDFLRDANLLQLQRELEDGTYAPGPYRHFYVLDPKRRKISAAPFRDRVVHHAIVNVLEPLFERRFIFDSYACRRGKGTHRALHRAQYYLLRHPYFLKTDIVRFFPNVDHELLVALLRRTIADPSLMRLAEQIIASGTGILEDEATSPWFPGDDLFAALRPRGLPIGNLTSQFFANVLLDPIDHFLKEELRVPGYVRYADDLLLFGDSKAQLWEWCAAFRQRLLESRLRLHTTKTQVGRSTQGLTYLGFRVFPDSRRLSQAAIRRFQTRRRRQQRQFAAGEIQARDVGPSLRAWLAHCQGANSRAITRILLRKLTLHRSPLPPPDPCQSHFARLSESCPRCNERGERRHKR